MNKNSFTHKILPIIAIFMFVLFTLTTSCFAYNLVDFNFSYNGTSFSVGLPEEYLSYDYYFIEYRSNNGRNYVQFYFSNSPIVLNTSNGCAVETTDGSQYLMICNNYAYLSSFEEIIDYMNSNRSINMNTYYSGNTNLGSVPNVLVGNYDLVTSGGDLVFQAPVEEVAKQTILAPVMTETTQEGTTLQEEMKTKTLQEIVEILPIVIPVMVGLIACLIGLKYLWKLLRKS